MKMDSLDTCTRMILYVSSACFMLHYREVYTIVLTHHLDCLHFSYYNTFIFSKIGAVNNTLKSVCLINI